MDKRDKGLLKRDSCQDFNRLVVIGDTLSTATPRGAADRVDTPPMKESGPS